MNVEPWTDEEFRLRHTELMETCRNLELTALACLMQARRITQKFIDELHLEKAKLHAKASVERSLEIARNSGPGACAPQSGDVASGEGPVSLSVGQEKVETQ